MADPTPENIAWMRQIHLFHHLGDEEIAAYLEQMEVKRYRAGEQIAEYEEPPKGLCFIRRGWVRLYRLGDEGEVPFGLLEQGDYFGVGGVVQRENCQYSAKAIADTEIYCWSLPYALLAMDEDQRIQQFLEIVWRSRKRALKHKPRWLSSDEMVYLFLTRAKIAFLRYKLPLIFLGLILAVGAIAVALSGIMALEWIMLALLAMWLGVAAWTWFDWINDYYIVTNRRIAWVEKVLLLYESRREAPLRTVISFSVNTDFAGQTLGYGDVIVRTYAGSVRLDRIANPDYVSALLNEYWQRTRHVITRESQEQIRRQIRQKLGLPIHSIDQESPETAVLKPLTVGEVPAEVSKSRLAKLWDRLFKQRFVREDGTIVYRKHPIRLLKRSVKPMLFFIAVIIPMIFVGIRWHQNLRNYHLQWVYWALTAIAFLFWAGWEFYQVLDWDNDEYLITSSHIVDIYRKPFGSEERQESPLESVENISYERPGLLAMLFNFGNVKIHVGATTMVFEAVGKPDRVQQEIYERAELFVNKQREQQAASERERVLDLLKYYHEIVSEGDEGDKPDVL